MVQVNINQCCDGYLKALALQRAAQEQQKPTGKVIKIEEKHQKKIEFTYMTNDYSTNVSFFGYLLTKITVNLIS